MNSCRREAATASVTQFKPESGNPGRLGGTMLFAAWKKI
jgi:hypothetical protein